MLPVAGSLQPSRNMHMQTQKHIKYVYCVYLDIILFLEIYSNLYISVCHIIMLYHISGYRNYNISLT
jgi:hypothetical protein